MRRLTRSVMIGTWALALTTLACGEAEPESTHRFDVETIDGVEVAITRGGPRFTEPLFTLEEQLTLVQEMSDEESLLYRPRGFARGADGNYYVADSGNGRIAVFSDTGRFLRAIGREGQGPGEFSDSIVLQAPFDQEIQVFDRSAQRTQRFEFDGTFIGGVTLPTEGRLDSLLREPDGTLVLTRGEEGDSVDEFIHASTIIGVIPPGADAPVAEITTSSTAAWLMSTVQTEEFTATVMLQIPFSAEPGALRHGDGVVLVNGDIGEVEWRDVDGTLRRKASVERPPTPVTEPMREAVAESFRAARERDAEEGRQYPAPMPELWYPEESGWWRNGQIDDAGYFWLQDAAQASQTRDDDETRYEILSPAGELLGHVFLPFTRFRVQDGTILAVDEDPETEEARLRVFRLRPNAPGFAYPERVS